MEIKRRNRSDLWLPSEQAIQNAMWEIEKIGADVKLTEAIIHLQKAKDLVSDYIDSNVSTFSDPPHPPPVLPGPR